MPWHGNYYSHLITPAGQSTVPQVYSSSLAVQNTRRTYLAHKLQRRGSVRQVSSSLITDESAQGNKSFGKSKPVIQ